MSITTAQAAEMWREESFPCNNYVVKNIYFHGVVLWREGLTCWRSVIVCFKGIISAAKGWVSLHSSSTNTQIVCLRARSYAAATRQSLPSRAHILRLQSVFKNSHYITSKHRSLPSRTHILQHQSALAAHLQKSTEKITPSTQMEAKKWSTT
jgi:hypothetical protein